MLQYNPSISGSLSVTGSLIVTNGVIGTVNGVDIQIFSSSINQVVTNIQTATGSQDGRLGSIESFTSSVSTTNTFTASAELRLNDLESKSASVDDTNTSQTNRLNSLEEKTGSLATTGSNTFYGTQTFSGSLYIKENLIVQGSSSLQNITASAVDIGTNRIILNVDNPSVRYAGISVYDSGSTAGTGSLWWDSVENHWLYEHPSDSAAPYNSAILISGPKNAGSLGEELELVNNYIVKAVGGDHISSSAIYDDGTTIGLKSNTEVSGTFKVSYYTSSFDGNVGIGTTNPGNKLHVYGGGILIENNQDIRTKNSSGTQRTLVYMNSSNKVLLVNDDGDILLSATGNIGIGTTNPRNVKVQINGTSTFEPMIPGAATGSLAVVAANSNYGLYMASRSNGDSWMQVARNDASATVYNLLLQPNGGNVGIGSTIADNTYQGLTIYGSNPSIRLKGSGGSSWNWIEFVNSAGTNNFSMGVNQTTPFFAIKAGAGMDSPNFVMLSNGNIGINDSNPSKRLSVNYGSTQLGGLQIYGSMRQETIFRSTGEHCFLYMDSAHSNTYFPMLSLQRNSTTLGTVQLQRASNSDAYSSYAESEMVMGTTTSTPVSLQMNGNRKLIIDTSGNTTVTGDFTQNGSMTTFVGYLASPDGYPSCNENARIYDLGTINSNGSSNSSIIIEVMGSHRGYNVGSYSEYKRYVCWVGDRISSSLLESAGGLSRVGIFNGTNGNGLDGNTASGWNLRLIVNPNCGAGVSYMCRVTYNNLNFTRGNFNYTYHSSLNTTVT